MISIPGLLRIPNIVVTNSRRTSIDGKIRLHNSIHPRGGPYARIQTVSGPYCSDCFLSVLRISVFRRNSDCPARKQPPESAQQEQQDSGNLEAGRLSHTYIKQEA